MEVLARKKTLRGFSGVNSLNRPLSEERISLLYVRGARMAGRSRIAEWRMVSRSTTLGPNVVPTRAAPRWAAERGYSGGLGVAKFRLI
jgi:hypothetical protein